MKPYKVSRWYDTCPICRSDNTIKLITKTRYNIDYTEIIDNELELPKMLIGMRCSACKSVFTMKWRSSDDYRYPIPSTTVELDKFINNFKGDIKDAIN